MTFPTTSVQEEYCALLTLIAGLLAWQADLRWLAYFLFAKAILDTIESILIAIHDGRERRKQK